MRGRTGFTLVELMVVLMVLAITAAAAIPAFATTSRTAELIASDSIAMLLTRARDIARERGAATELVIAPRDARYWLTTNGGTATGVIPLVGTQRLVGSDTDRVRCAFSAQGPATPCAIAVRGTSDVIVRVDAWTGLISTTRSSP